MSRQNKDTVRQVLGRYIDLDLYANSVDRDMQALLDELLEECAAVIAAESGLSTKAMYSIAYKAIKEKTEAFGAILNDRLEKEAGKIKESQEQFLSSLYGSMLKKADIKTGRILFAPFNGKDTVRSFADRTKTNILRSYDNAMRSGYIFGKTSGDIIQQAAGNLGSVGKGMRNGIITAVTSFAKQTDRLSFLMSGIPVVWISTLDGNQCLLCTSLNGTEYKNPSLAPAYPAHYNCRCVLVPAGSVKDNIPGYEEYIGSLSDDEQRHILGRNRFEMYKDGKLSLRQFINNGEILSVGELEQL